ncbi:MAG: T9SS type A sorting domain-containing protein [Flavipsychrobacter sp.]
MPRRPKTQWAKYYGGSREEEVMSIIQDRDGHFVFGGSSSSSDGDIIGHHGGSSNIYSDFWIMKLDDTGKILWEKSYGGRFAEVCNKIIQTSDGGYIGIGTTSSRDGDAFGNHDTTTVHIGTKDVLVIKTDKDGVVEWEKCYGGTGNENGNDIRQTSDGGYVFTGMAGSVDGDVKGIHTIAGGFATPDVWVVKLDATGKLMWQRCLGGTNFDEAYSIRQTSNNNYLLCGNTSSADGDVMQSFGNIDGWVLKLDDTGKIIWQKSMGGSNTDEFVSIVQSADGNYVFGGSTASNDSMVSGNHLDTAGRSNYDMWVVKTDTNGNILWQKLYGGASFDRCYEMQPTKDSGFILNGVSTSWDGDVHFNYDGDSGLVYDCWVLRLKPDGDTLWERVLGGTVVDVGRSIAQTNDSTYIMSGNTNSKNGDVTGNKANIYAAWVVRLSNKPMPRTAVSPYDLITALSVYPNPSCTSFLFRYHFTGNTNLEVVDITGRGVCSGVLPGNSTYKAINATGWQPGAYFYKVLQNGQVLASGKLVKE